MYIVKKSNHNPIFTHKKENIFEAHSAFNMSVLQDGPHLYGVYRAESSIDRTRLPERLSTIGITHSDDGIHFENRKQYIAPTEQWENCGCEDPRITFFEGKYYTFYTALSGYPYNADNIKVAVAISDTLVDSTIKEKHLVTPFNAKAMAIFPRRINGKVTVILSVNTDRDNMQLSIAQVDNIENLWDESSVEFWSKWYKNLEMQSFNIRRDVKDHYEGGPVPIYTKDGWLFIHSYIQNYRGSSLERIFGIEALLLDHKDPLKIIARTEGPIIVPSEEYELLGPIENICFPTGSILKGKTLSIYYGVVDAKTCVAEINLEDLLHTMTESTRDRHKFTRVSRAPVIVPDPDHDWESLATFNPGALRIEDKTYIFYRAMSRDNTSTIGLAISADGAHIDERLVEPIYIPRADFENKKVPGGNSGCEDPRVLIIEDNLYMFYTAYNGVDKPMVAVTKISKKDFLDRKWSSWDTPYLISQRDYDDKDTCVFPERFDDKYFVMHRIGTDICGDYIDSLDFEKEKLDRCFSILSPRVNTWDSLKVGIACPPLKTPSGWLVLYHGISRTSHTYRVGVILLDLKDPTYVISRSADPILEPELKWEKEGIVPNVVFPCGMCVIDEYLYIYYGGADKVVGVAKMELKILLDALSR